MYVTANATLLFFASRYRWLRFLCVSRLRDLGKGFGEVGKGSRNKSFAAGVGGISGAFAWNAFLRRGTGLRQLWFQLLFDVVISPVFVRAAFLHFLLHPSSLVFARANTAAKVRLRLGNWYVWRFGWDVWTRRGYHPNWIECSYFEDLAVWELLTDPARLEWFRVWQPRDVSQLFASNENISVWGDFILAPWFVRSIYSNK